MEFREVKDYCKHCGAGNICPATFKNCNADNCPLCFSNMNSDDCDNYCPIVDTYRNSARLARLKEKEQLEKRDEAEAALKDKLDAIDKIETELKTTVDAAHGVLNGVLYDLKDKLRDIIKQLEP